MYILMAKSKYISSYTQTYSGVVIASAGSNTTNISTHQQPTEYIINLPCTGSYTLYLVSGGGGARALGYGWTSGNGDWLKGYSGCSGSAFGCTVTLEQGTYGLVLGSGGGNSWATDTDNNHPTANTSIGGDSLFSGNGFTVLCSGPPPTTNQSLGSVTVSTSLSYTQLLKTNGNKGSSGKNKSGGASPYGGFGRGGATGSTRGNTVNGTAQLSTAGGFSIQLNTPGTTYSPFHLMVSGNSYTLF